MKSELTGRSAAREIVYKYLFSYSFKREDDALLYRTLIEESKIGSETKAFCDALLKAALKNYDATLKKIEGLVEGYKTERIYSTDRMALLMAITELDEFDTPRAVVIDEAVNLSAKYSTEKSVDFVNGVLAKYKGTYGETD